MRTTILTLLAVCLCIVVYTCATTPKPGYSAYVVAKEYEAAHMCCSTGKHTYESAVIVAPAHQHHLVEERYTVIIANRWEIVSMNVEKSTYERFHPGDKVYVDSHGIIKHFFGRKNNP